MDSNQITQLALVLGMYLLELGEATQTDRFHCNTIIPVNPFYKPEHTRNTPLVQSWRVTSIGPKVAQLYPKQIAYDPSGWFTLLNPTQGS